MDAAELKKKILAVLSKEEKGSEVCVNHVMPCEVESGDTVYVVEYKVVGKGFGMAVFNMDDDGEVVRVNRDGTPFVKEEGGERGRDRALTHGEVASICDDGEKPDGKKEE